MTILIENPKEKLEDYTETKITINGKEYTGYQNEEKGYALIYGTNIENNETGWYLYNIKEESFQKYNDKMFDKINNDFDEEKEDYKMVILGLSGLSLLLLIIVIAIACSKQRQKKKMKEKIEQFLEQTKELKTLGIKEKLIENETEEIKDETAEIKVVEDIVVENEEPKEEKKKETKKKDKKEKKSKKDKKKEKKEELENGTEEIEKKEEVIAVQVPSEEKEEVVEEKTEEEDDDELSYEFLDSRARKKYQKKNLKK